jgi:hypothetical protein
LVASKVSICLNDLEYRLWGPGMSEENDGAEAHTPGVPDTAGLATDFAMEEARNDPSLREDVAAFLRDQRSLIDIQKHHLLKQFSLTLWEKRLGVLLRVATAFIGMTVAAGAGWLVWNAAHSKDLVIDAFQAPPELADRGLSGSVLAAKLSDKIAAMQAQTNSQRAPKSYASFSEGLKLAGARMRPRPSSSAPQSSISPRQTNPNSRARDQRHEPR